MNAAAAIRVRLAIASLAAQPLMQRTLILIGLALVIVGVLWPWLGRLGLGRLPGDFRVQTEHGVFYFPVVTCIVISVVISLVLWLLRR